MTWKQVGVKFDRVLIDPSKEELEDILDKAAEEANEYLSVRCAKPPDFNEVFQSESGRVETNGGGVKPRQPPGAYHTSQVGCAWWTDALNHKHVRVISARRGIRSQKITSIFGEYSGNKPDFWCVYPGVGELVKLQDGKEAVVLTCKCGKKGNIKELTWDGKQCGLCREKARYEADTGFLPGW